jgi:hypothetical protein
MGRVFALLIVLSGLLAFSGLSGLPGHSTARAEEGQVTFQGKHLRLYFQPRVRAGSQDGRTLREEVWRLNLIMNVFENYLEYLVKLSKIASDNVHPSITRGREPRPGSHRVPIRELGFNSVSENQ